VNAGKKYPYPVTRPHHIRLTNTSQTRPTIRFPSQGKQGCIYPTKRLAAHSFGTPRLFFLPPGLASPLPTRNYSPTFLFRDPSCRTSAPTCDAPDHPDFFGREYTARHLGPFKRSICPIACQLTQILRPTHPCVINFPHISDPRRSTLRFRCRFHPFGL
jgi:hypothetical protein